MADARSTQANAKIGPVVDFQWHYYTLTFKTIQDGFVADTKQLITLSFNNANYGDSGGNYGIGWKYGENLSQTFDRHEIYLSELKLEEGMVATSWQENSADAAGRLDVRYIPYGKWNAKTVYERKDQEVPYVDHEGLFYYLKERRSYNNKPGTTNGDAYWVLMNQMRPILTNGVIADYAKMASAVFCGDWMYSQHGRVYNGSTWTVIDSSNPNYGGKAGYAWFVAGDPTGVGGTAQSPHFAPAWCVDLLTGTMVAARGNFRLDNDGSVSVNGNIRTVGASGSVVMHDGCIDFYGLLPFPNIVLGVDADGCSVLKFYDKDGNFKYDLGPDGIEKELNNVDGAFDGIGSYGVFVSLSTNWSSAFINSMSITTTYAYYRFKEGYTYLEGVKSYDFDGAYNNKVYNGNTMDVVDQHNKPGSTLSLISAGTYVGPEEQTTMNGVFRRCVAEVESNGASPRTAGYFYYEKESENKAHLVTSSGAIITCSTSVPLRNYLQNVIIER